MRPRARLSNVDRTTLDLRVRHRGTGKPFRPTLAISVDPASNRIASINLEGAADER